MKSVTRIVQEAVMNNGQPLKAIASKISKPYPTLLRELNPYDKGAKLGVETLLDLMRVTRDHRPLQYMADQLGLTLVPKAEAGKSNGNGLGMAHEATHGSESSWTREMAEHGS